jgi:hypothetical protein
MRRGSLGFENATVLVAAHAYIHWFGGDFLPENRFFKSVFAIF